MYASICSPVASISHHLPHCSKSRLSSSCEANMPVVAFVQALTLPISKDLDFVPLSTSSQYYCQQLRLPRHIRVLPACHKLEPHNTPCLASAFNKSKHGTLPHALQTSSLYIHASNRLVSKSQLSTSPPPTKNIHVVIFSNFSTNPILAIRDRLSDPIFAVMLAVTAVITFFITLVIIPRRKVSPAVASSAHSANSRVSSNTPSITPRSTPRNVGSKESSQNCFPPLAAPTPGESAIWLNMRSVIHNSLILSIVWLFSFVRKCSRSDCS